MSAEKITAEKIYELMVSVQAKLEQVLKREEPITRAELAEFIKALRAQAAPVQDPVKLAQQLLPELIAQLPKQLPVKLDPKTEEIVKLLSPVVNRQVAAIEATNERLLRGLNQHLAAINAMLATQLQALKERNESLEATAAKFPTRVDVNIVDGFRNLALVALSPVLFVLGVLGATGSFSKEPVATYNGLVYEYSNLKERYSGLVKRRDSLQRVESALRNELYFYKTQVRENRKRFPKLAPKLLLYAPVKK